MYNAQETSPTEFVNSACAILPALLDSTGAQTNLGGSTTD